MLKFLFGLLLLTGPAFGQHDPHFVDGMYGIVHLFEWHWGTIADECETLLGPNKIGGVQTSPPNENRIIGDRPWWERYQPISYKLETRSGSRQDFIDMVERCNNAGVRVYPDVVINHMCGAGGSGTGTAGSAFNADVNNPWFEGVPYSKNDFNNDICYTQSGDIESYSDKNQVRNCRLVGLLDLALGKDYVRGKVADYLNDLISIGVAGFRVDACKHMWPGDLENVFGRLNDLNTRWFNAGSRPYIFQEVIDQGGEPITAGEYVHLGAVTEFKYGISVGNNVHSLEYLNNLGPAWGLLHSDNALVFMNNHDNQRGHGGGGHIISFHDPLELKVTTAYMLAYGYGTPRVMSSYYFSNSDEGPPSSQRSVNADGSCGNGWVCEHRWRQIKNMFGFAAAVKGQPLSNWQGIASDKIAFSRGNKGFIALSSGGSDINMNMNTNLPDGTYCNVISGDYSNGKCSGDCVTVSGGFANVYVSGSEGIFAIHTNAMADECNTGGGTGGGGGGTECTDCNCASKTDCGFVGIDESGCDAKGCMWCPDYSSSSGPWCIYGSGSGGEGGSCSIEEGSRLDCGYYGIQQTECESQGCCWAESNTNGVPWCYNSA